MSVYGHVTAKNQANRGTSMAEGAIEFLKHPATFFSAAELAKAIGADFETINNWVRRGMITRARIGGDSSGADCSRPKTFTKRRSRMSL
jgi:hypothetical protein